MSFGFVHRDSCPVCASQSYVKLCDIGYDDPRLREFLADFYHGRAPLQLLQKGRYSVVSCANCGLVYQDSVLDDEGMQALYEYWIDDDASLAKKRNAGAGLFRQYARQVQTLIRMAGERPGRIRVLDFGMGWGYWSRMAQAHGLDVSGFELSQRRQQHARELGIRVISELPEPGDRFDIIYASQVFEHLPDPLETLRQLRARLAPRGLIHVRVPDGRGVADTLSWRGWIPELVAIHPLEHINCFTRPTLLRLAAGAGLAPARAPLTLAWGSLFGGLKREFNDRFVTTHLYLRRAA